MSSPLFWMPVYTESQFRGHVDATTQFSAAGSQRQRATSTPALQASVSRYTYPRPVATHGSNQEPYAPRTAVKEQAVPTHQPIAHRQTRRLPTDGKLGQRPAVSQRPAVGGGQRPSVSRAAIREQQAMADGLRSVGTINHQPNKRRQSGP